MPAPKSVAQKVSQVENVYYIASLAVAARPANAEDGVPSGAAPADEGVVDPDAVGGVVFGHVNHLVVHLAVGADAGQHLAGGRGLGGDA